MPRPPNLSQESESESEFIYDSRRHSAAGEVASQAAAFSRERERGKLAPVSSPAHTPTPPPPYLNIFGFGVSNRGYFLDYQFANMQMP